MKTSNVQATTPESLEIKIERFKCFTWNSFLYKHWRKGWDAKKELEELVYWEALERCKGQKIAFDRARVTIKACFREKRRHDPDNLFVKPILDGIVKAEILPDDNGQVIEALTLIALTGQKEDSITIIIEKTL